MIFTGHLDKIREPAVQISYHSHMVVFNCAILEHIGLVVRMSVSGHRG